MDKIATLVGTKSLPWLGQNRYLGWDKIATYTYQYSYQFYLLVLYQASRFRRCRKSLSLIGWQEGGNQMKKDEVEIYVKKNKLFQSMDGSGIYALAADKKILYVGKTKNLFQRCCQHFYNIENGYYSDDNKYRLLLALQLGGIPIYFRLLDLCSIDNLSEKESEYINKYLPPLNKDIPGHHRQNIDNLTIDQLVEKMKSDECHSFLSDYKDGFFGNYFEDFEDFEDLKEKK